MALIYWKSLTGQYIQTYVCVYIKYILYALYICTHTKQKALHIIITFSLTL